jgi:hypothetical protein
VVINNQLITQNARFSHKEKVHAILQPYFPVVWKVIILLPEYMVSHFGCKQSKSSRPSEYQISRYNNNLNVHICRISKPIFLKYIQAVHCDPLSQRGRILHKRTNISCRIFSLKKRKREGKIWMYAHTSITHTMGPVRHYIIFYSLILILGPDVIQTQLPWKLRSLSLPVPIYTRATIFWPGRDVQIAVLLQEIDKIHLRQSIPTTIFSVDYFH